MKYLPFLDGKYSTEPALVVLAKVPEPCHQLIFQVDEQYQQYIANKQQCRREDAVLLPKLVGISFQLSTMFMGNKKARLPN